MKVLLEELRYQSRDALSGTGLGKDAGVGTSLIRDVGSDPGLDRGDFSTGSAQVLMDRWSRCLSGILV